MTGQSSPGARNYAVSLPYYLSRSAQAAGFYGNPQSKLRRSCESCFRVDFYFVFFCFLYVLKDKEPLKHRCCGEGARAKCCEIFSDYIELERWNAGTLERWNAGTPFSV
jgi:hypothetical protein